jgi:uncharacterized membrane protein HdeD (DUF308 family)
LSPAAFGRARLALLAQSARSRLRDFPWRSAANCLVARLHARTRMNRIADHWWMFVARGAVSLALAVLLLLGPGWSSMETLVAVFGPYAIVDGAGSLAFVFGARDVRRAAYIGRGALGIAAGGLAFAHPGSTTALYVIVGCWAIATGGLEVAFGWRTWTTVPRAVSFLLAGALTFGFGLTLLHFPLESIATLRGFLTAYAVVNGVAAIAIGERLLHVPAPAPRAT